MKLYLVQHGEAFDEAENPARSLTDKGRKDVDKVSKLLKSSGIEVRHIEHSGKLRARETAEIIAENLGQERIVRERRGLFPKDPVYRWSKDITSRNANIMLVGHLPFLSKLAGVLLNGDEMSEPIRFRYGCVACFEKNDLNRWTVNWVVIPDLLE